MNPPPHPIWKKGSFWLAAAAVLAAVLTGWSHLAWLRRTGALHGIPAFFACGLVLLLVFAFVRISIGTFLNGWRSLFTRQSLQFYAWTAASALSLLVLFYSIELWRGKRAWAAVARDAQRLGEPLTYDAVLPPAVPHELNFAAAPLFRPILLKLDPSAITHDAPSQEDLDLQAIEKFAPGFRNRIVRIGPWFEQERTRLDHWVKAYFRTRSADMTNHSPAEIVLEELSRFSGSLDQVRDYSTRPYARFDTVSVFQPDRSMNVLCGLIRILRLKASAELALGHTDDAFRDVHLALRLAEFSWRASASPGIWTAAPWTRTLTFFDAVQPLWEGLADHRWTQQQLADFDQRLRQITILPFYREAARREALSMAAFLETVIPTANHSSSSGIELPMDSADQRAVYFIRLIYPTGWSLQNQAAVLQFYFQWAAPLVDTAGQRVNPTRRDDVTQSQCRSPDVLFATSDPLFPVFIIPKMVQSMRDVGQGFSFVQTVLNQAILACGLEHFYQEHRRYPNDLMALSTRLLPPLDIFDGQPLRYQPSGASFAIYSVGWNVRDDASQPSPRSTDSHGLAETLPDLEQGDWTWIQPAPRTSPGPN